MVLNLLLQAYVEGFVKNILSNPEHGVLRRVLESMDTNYREKVVRATFLLFRKACEDRQCLELLIDLDLARVIENLLKGTLK